MMGYQVMGAIDQAKKFIEGITYMSKEEQLLAFDFVSRALQELTKEVENNG